MNGSLGRSFPLALLYLTAACGSRESAEQAHAAVQVGMSLTEVIKASFVVQPDDRQVYLSDADCRFQVGRLSGRPYMMVNRKGKRTRCDFARPDEEVFFADNAELIAAVVLREPEFSPISKVLVFVNDGSGTGDGNAFEVQFNESGEVSYVGALEFMDF